MPDGDTFVDDLERIVGLVSDWAVDTVNMVVEELSPDGRPFGMRQLTDHERLTEHVELRGNPEAWENWINERVLQIIQTLEGSGIAPDRIAAIQPYDIMAAHAIDYSREMEQLISKRADADE